MSEFKTSDVAWKRFKRILSGGIVIALCTGVGAYYFGGGTALLNADGLVVRDRVMVSASYDARIKEILVRPGDRVEAGDIIATVEAPSIVRTLAEVSIERAKLEGRVAQLQARKEVVSSLLPMAQASAKQSSAFLDMVNRAGATGLAVSKTMQEMAVASLQAADRHLSLIAERRSIEAELAGTIGPLQEMQAAYEHLHRIYAGGILRAPASGYVGSSVASVGEILGQGSTKVTNVYTGKSYALAYMPESYVLNVEEGQSVIVKARGRNIEATIDRILPVTDALPPEFQAPNKVRDRGQVVRIEVPEESFPMEQKIRVTTCHLTGCQDSLDVQTKEVIRAYLLHIQTVVVASLYRAAPYGIRALDTLKDGAVDAMVLLRRVRHAVPLLFASQASARSGPTETMLGRWPGSDPARRSMIEESQMHLHLHGPQMLAAIP